MIHSKEHMYIKLGEDPAERGQKVIMTFWLFLDPGILGVVQNVTQSDF